MPRGGSGLVARAIDNMAVGNELDTRDERLDSKRSENTP